MAQVNPTPEHGQEDPKSPVELGVKSAEITHFPIPVRQPRERGRFRLLPKSILKLGLSLTALTAIFGGGYIAYEKVPAVHQVVDGLATDVADWLKPITKNLHTQSIEEKFPISLPKENYTPVTGQDEQNLWQRTKTFDLDNHTLTMGFPFDQTTINRNPNIRMDQQFDAILPPFIDANKLKQEGVKNVTTLSGFSNGDEYKLIYDSTKYRASIITIAIAGVTQGEGSNTFTPAYTNLLVIFKDKQTGKSDIRQVVEGLYAKSLVPNKLPPTDHGSVFEDGIPINSGDPILKLTTNYQDWDGKNEVLPGERGQFVIRSIYMQDDPIAPIPLTANFLSANGHVVSQE